jgi:periplasmic divalent cation tolerance protein
VYKPEVPQLQGFSVSQAVIILTTAPSSEMASQLAQALVEHRLAACVNIVGPMTSVYRWKDEVQREPEHQLIVKTSRACIDAVRDAFRRLHPYEVPEFLVVDIAGGDPAYLSWLIEAVRPIG